MAKEKESGYRKNFSLIITFLVLISVVFLLSLIFAFNFSRKNVENDFVSAKANVLEATIRPYNDFFLNKIPEISFYNGYLDSASASRFIDSLQKQYTFVSKVTFYDTEIRNERYEGYGVNVGDFAIGMKGVYQFGPSIAADSVKIFDEFGGNFKWRAGDFSTLSLKLITFIQKMDTTAVPSQDELFANFSNVQSNRLDYFNIPSFELLKTYKRMINTKLPTNPIYQQDMLSFDLDQRKLAIENTHPNLYQNIRIEPISYDPIDVPADYLTGEINLGGPFSEYKLFFMSSRSFLQKEIFSYFLPLAAIVFLIYSMLTAVAILIYRNLNINQRMFKLQYDFLTNLTHEFKTPVSVIKIAGNNIKSATSLSAREQQMYGKILDDEAEKLNGLMNKLLAFTQIENKSITLNKDTIDMRDFIETTIEVHKLKHPDFDFTYDLKGFSSFTTDPVLFGSLFDNLAENAYKYSKDGHKKLHISARLDREKVVFIFKDEGIGIPAKDTQHIFKKFYRVQNRYNQNGSVGLGLAFCKELVQLMGGEISVHSELDKGTTFKIVLPYINN